MTATDLQCRIEETARLLLDACRERGIVVSGDQRVSECAAAGLLGIARGTLKNARNTFGTAPRHFRTPVDGSRISYRIYDLAEWIESEGH